MKKVLLAGTGVLALCIVVVLLWLAHMLSNLPDVSVLKRYRPAAAAEILDRNGAVLTQYYENKFRVWTPISSLPDAVIHAVITAEDDTFFEHKGINYKATWDAFLHDVEKRRFARGGSTITQQMIKNVLLSKQKTIGRKIREFILARRAEEILTKRRILEIYLNEVEWGDNIYGIEAASRFYLDKHASSLNAAEAALLAGMLPNPHYFNPFKRMGKTKERQEHVLFNMCQAKLLSQEEYDEAVHFPLKLRQEGSSACDLSGLTAGGRRLCYQEALEQILVSLLGEQKLYRSGLSIKTTLDKPLQDDLSRWEDSLPEKTPEEPDRITVVRQGEEIRAIVCTAGEDTLVRSELQQLGLPYDGYDVSSMSIDTVDRENIILNPQRVK